MAALELREAARNGDCGKLRELLDGDGGAAVVDERTEAIIDAVNTQTKFTAFHFACGMGHANCAVELVQRGCDMTLRTKNGWTGKDMAECEKHTAVLEGLRALVAEQLRARQQLVATADELCVAAYKGDCGKLRKLLDGGGAAAVNERTEGTNTETGEKFETTALIHAVVFNQHGRLELLP